MKTTLFLSITAFSLAACSSTDLQKISKSDSARVFSNLPIIAESAEITLGKGYANKYFYQPGTNYPRTPKNYQLNYTDVTFGSTNQTKLHGWFIPSVHGTKNSKITVVYSHGKNGTVGNHVNRVAWLAKSGFNVLMYDYRGFGKSTGTITKKGVIDDVHAAFRYTLNRSDIKHTKIVSYGHSLGGAKSIAALGLKRPPNRLVMAINESSFASYSDMGAMRGGLTGRNLTDNTYSPELLINKISIPIYLIHGTADTTIPIQQAKKLKAKANSNLYYWEVAGGNHYNCLEINNFKFRNKLRQIIKSKE